MSFFRIPKVVTNKCKAKEELSRRRRAGFLSAIKRDGLTEKVLSNDRICSRHYPSGKPADLLDENNPDWLPTLNLGHRNSLSESTARAAEERWERMKEREARRNTEVVSDSTNTETAEVVSESGDGQACLVDAGVQTSLTSKSIDESMDYFHGKISSLIKEIDRLKDMRSFTEEALMDNNDFILAYLHSMSSKLC